MTDQKVGYLPSLTAMRGFAAIWVMLFHIDVSLFYRDLGALVPHEATGLIAGGYMWVDFFFILSGFVITHVYAGQFTGGLRRQAVGRYLKARFLRIYPLHLFTLLLLVCFWQALEHTQPQLMDDSMRTYFDPAALPSNLLLTNAMNQYVFLSWNIVSWSIGAEWWTYFLGMLMLLLISRGRAAEVLIVGGFAGVCLLSTVHPEGKLDLTFNYGFLRCLFEFSMGVGLYRVHARGMGRALFRTDGFVFTVLALIALALHYDWNDLSLPPLFALLVTAGANNRGLFSRIMESRVPRYLGRISYSIYLMHGVWFMVFWAYLPQIKLAYGFDTLPLQYRITYLVAFVAVSILSAALTYRYVEVPGRSLFRRNVSRSVAPAGVRD